MYINFKTILKHLIIFSLLSIGMLIIVFVMGLFSTLHPDAYIDGFMSIVYVYIIVLIVHFLVYLIKITTNFDTFTLPKTVYVWYKNIGILVNIAIIFTVITVVNSVMMITGIDTPKTGSFAYLHLLVRTLIIVLAVVISMYKAVLDSFKSLRAYRLETKERKQQLKKEKIQSIRSSFINKPLEVSASLFTLITVVGCFIMIIFAPLLNPQGGNNLYLALIILYSILLFTTLSYAFFEKHGIKRAAK